MLRKGSQTFTDNRSGPNAGHIPQWLLALVMLLAMGLSACAPQVAVGATEPPPAQTPAPSVETEAPAETQTPAETPAPPAIITDMNSLTTALENADADVELADYIQDSFFTAGGRYLKVNGQDVQVFEFPDEAARKAAAATIQANGFIIGQAAVDWMSQPYFFSAGNLIVLYVGGDAATLSLLQNVLGDPVTK